ncbi:unnamed protein product, partial [Rhizoctonia solani]
DTSKIFPPLGSAIESLLLCLDGFEIAVRNHQDYEDLAIELTTLSESLKHHMSESSILVSSSTNSAVMSIERLVAEIQDRLGHASGGDIQDVDVDDQVLVRYYRGIEAHFRLLQANASMSTRRILDEQLVNTRLEDLTPAKEAAYDSSLSSTISRRGCTQGTRVAVLTGLDNWLYDSTSSSVYWMNGMAGTGKTTIAWTFCDRVEKRELLAASFFCTRSSAECKDVTRIIPTIAYQIARYSFPFRSELCQILGENPDIRSKNVQKQFEQLLIEPLKQVKDAIPEHILVVIDALDECEERTVVETILDMLLRFASEAPLKFLITSRPEPEIYDKLVSSNSRQVIHLHEIERSLVRADIELYLKEELSFMVSSPSDIEQLVERSGTLFIYTATIVRYIRYRKRFADPHKRLRSVLSMTPEATKTHTHIDALYTAVLQSALSEDEMEAGEVEDIRIVLRMVLSAQEPISTKTIATLAGIDDPERVVYALHPLRSVLHQSEETGLVSTLHASFSDFMFNRERSRSYSYDIAEHSQLVAQRCFIVMQEQLRFNICGLSTSFVFDVNVENLQERIKNRISLTLAYACRYWASHLASAPRLDTLQTMLDEFLSHRLLFWMEVLNLRREMISSIEVFLKAKEWLSKTLPPPSNLVLLVDDAQKFAMGYTASFASLSTPHIYISFLPLCPRSSLVYQHYWKRMQGLLELKGSLIQNRETAPLAIWSVSANVRSITYAPDGRRIAVGNSVCGVAVRNAYSGTLLAGPVRAHGNPVNSVAFSPDGRWIASGSFDQTVQLWNSYNCIPTLPSFKGHTGSVLSVTFSPDSTRLASGSSDHTIRIWSINDGTLLLGPLKGHSHDVNSVAFSPNGHLIASASNDGTIRLWKSHDGTSTASPFVGHGAEVTSVAFTPDGTRLVSASSDKTIRIWSVSTGSPINNPFEGHTSPVFSVIVSPDGTRVASGSSDCTVRVWNIDDGSLISGPFVGHTEGILSIAFSPDGSRIMSSSRDRTIRVWNVRDKMFTPPPFPPPKSLIGIQSLVFSSGSTHFSSNHKNSVIRVWDATDGSFTTGPVEAQFLPSPLLSSSPNSTYVAAISKSSEVQIMSTFDGTVVAGPFALQRISLSTIRFSHNNRAVIMGCKDVPVVGLLTEDASKVLGLRIEPGP